MRQISFSTISLKQLREIVDIKPEMDETVFDKWLHYVYEISEEEVSFLYGLLEDERLLISGFSEEELKAKFIIPILNKVNFQVGGLHDWYERTLRGVVNGVEIGGKTDFLVATGIKEPEKPYFFIQEFKPSESSSSPQDQLLGELLVALHLNNESQMLGAYVLNELWRFLLLVKNNEERYTYYLSTGFNCLNKEDLKQLYASLQGVKADIMQRL
ncbi:MAG: hypothetical protein HC892_06880 [Saprospiraceae bacterium]|nr:hypothetical protein [Saprospiraceae bacterium]